jgi:hypothetical protein
MLTLAQIIAGTVQLGVQAWMFTNIEGMCDRDQKDGFWCPSTGVFGTASIIWGVIGPARQCASLSLSPFYLHLMCSLYLYDSLARPDLLRPDVLLPHRLPVPAHRMALHAQVA